METEKLYYTDPYWKEFTATVLGCEAAGDGFTVTLDRTAFYPEGGGQPCDLGTLGPARVTDVQERGGTVFHTVDRPVEAGETVRCQIDWARRFDHMQQHSGEHIVSGMLCARFHCDNVGFHLGEDLVTIDYNADSPWEALREVETAANAYLREDHPVDIRLCRGAELRAIDYRSKKEIEGDVRIELLCGERARCYLSRCWEQARAIGQALSVKPEASFAAVGKLQSELAARKAQAAQWQALAFEGIARQMAGRGDVLLLQPPMDAAAARRLADAVAGECGGLAAVFAGEGTSWSYALCRHGGDVSAETKRLNAALRGRGGGRGPLSQGSVPADRAEIEAYFADFTKG